MIPGITGGLGAGAAIASDPVMKEHLERQLNVMANEAKFRSDPRFQDGNWQLIQDVVEGPKLDEAVRAKIAGAKTPQSGEDIATSILRNKYRKAAAAAALGSMVGAVPAVQMMKDQP